MRKKMSRAGITFCAIRVSCPIRIGNYTTYKNILIHIGVSNTARFVLANMGQYRTRDTRDLPSLCAFGENAFSTCKLDPKTK